MNSSAATTILLSLSWSKDMTPYIDNDLKLNSINEPYSDHKHNLFIVYNSNHD